MGLVLASCFTSGRQMADDPVLCQEFLVPLSKLLSIIVSPFYSEWALDVCNILVSRFDSSPLVGSVADQVALRRGLGLARCYLRRNAMLRYDDKNLSSSTWPGKIRVQ